MVQHKQPVKCNTGCNRKAYKAGLCKVCYEDSDQCLADVPSLSLDDLAGKFSKSNLNLQAKVRAARAEIKIFPDVTWERLREFVGEDKFRLIVSDFEDIFGKVDLQNKVDQEYLIHRYSSVGGLTRFITELFPATTARKPYGDKQLKAIATLESVIRSGGVVQVLEPRAFAKTARMARAAMWAVLFGYRRCAISFQSSLKKAKQNIDRISNELTGNLALRAMFPELVASLVHAKKNLQLQKKQTHNKELTNVTLLADAIRIPDLKDSDGVPFPFSGARLFSMPLAKAAGLSLSDPDTLEDIRPDLLLIDDPQSHDRAMSGGVDSLNLYDIWRDSLKYLSGRGKQLAAFFAQTVCSEDDFASLVYRDPAIQSLRYGFFESLPGKESLEWWKTKYKDVLQGFDASDPQGQLKAQEAARALYLQDRDLADAGAVVSWVHAFDEETCESAIQAGMNNYINDEQAFWNQDQNTPKRLNAEQDIRCSHAGIIKKQHVEPRGVIPEWCDKLVCHIDVHDTLLYWTVAAGNSRNQMAIIDMQSWPEQHARQWSLSTVSRRFNDNPHLAGMSVEDQKTVAINLLVTELRNRVWAKTDGEVLKFNAIGVDCGDGFDLINKIVQGITSCDVVMPMRGAAPSPGDMSINERPKKAGESRGDAWSEKKSERSKQRYIEFDASYYKYRFHRGLAQFFGTLNSVSMFAANEQVHFMAAEQYRAEVPEWIKQERTGKGVWKWKKLPTDNHFFDNAVGCYVLLNRSGAKFDDYAIKKKKEVPRVSVAEAMESHFGKDY